MARSLTRQPLARELRARGYTRRSESLEGTDGVSPAVVVFGSCAVLKRPIRTWVAPWVRGLNGECAHGTGGSDLRVYRPCMPKSGLGRPSPMLKAVFDAPRWFYDHRLGWLMGRRFVALSHVGRKSGIERQSILEVATYHPETQEFIVASAFGAKADWYRNIQATAAHRVQVGRRQFAPQQRFLEPDEARAAADEFCRKHHLEARLAIPVFVAMGAAEKGAFSDPVELMASLPMVAFRPAHPGGE